MRPSLTLVAAIAGDLVATAALWLRTLRDAVVLSGDLAYLLVRIWRPAAAASWSPGLFREWLLVWLMIWAVQLPLWHVWLPTQSVLSLHAQLRLLVFGSRLLRRCALGAHPAASTPSYAMFDALDWVARSRPLSAVFLRLGAPVGFVVSRCLIEKVVKPNPPSLDPLWVAFVLTAVGLCYTLDSWCTLSQHARCWRRLEPGWSLGYAAFHRDHAEWREGFCEQHDCCAICLEPLCQVVSTTCGSSMPSSRRRAGLSACRLRPRFARTAAAGLSVARAAWASDEKDSFFDMPTRLVTLRRCNHSFHPSCLLQALRSGSLAQQCPICRSSLAMDDGLAELTADQEERLGGVLQAFAVGFVALATAAMIWLMLLVLFGLSTQPSGPATLQTALLANVSSNISANASANGTLNATLAAEAVTAAKANASLTDFSSASFSPGAHSLGAPTWLLEAYLSTSFFLGMASSLALRRMLEVLTDPEAGLLLSAAQVATAAFFQFLVEVLAAL